MDTPEYKLYSEIKNSITNYQDVLGDYINNYSVNEKKLIAKLNIKLKKEKKVKPQEEVEQVIAEQEKPEEEVVVMQDKPEEEVVVMQDKPEEEEVVEQVVVEEENPQQEEVVEQIVLEQENPQEEEEVVSQTKKVKRERCPNGTRKNKKTGLCEKYPSA
jgi:hypothetical protein